VPSQIVNDHVDGRHWQVQGKPQEFGSRSAKDQIVEVGKAGNKDIESYFEAVCDK
jgi:hypothetical protein